VPEDSVRDYSWGIKFDLCPDDCKPYCRRCRTGKKMACILKALLKKIPGLRFETRHYEAPGHAIELAKAAVNKGLQACCFGRRDGTRAPRTEIVNGNSMPTGDMKDVELGIIGTGTGSDYIAPSDVQNIPGILSSLDESMKKSVDLWLGRVHVIRSALVYKRIFRT